MLSFRVPRLVPQGGWRYEVPETGVLIEAGHRGDLLSAIRKHCAANDIEVKPGLEARVEDWICRRVSKDFCFGDEDGRPRARVMTMQKVREVTMAAVQVSKGRADPGIAERRAKYCGNCARHSRAMCTSCTGVVRWAARTVGVREYGYMDWLGLCDVDGVALAALVHLKNVEPKDRPPDCWAVKGLAL